MKDLFEFACRSRRSIRDVDECDGGAGGGAVGGDGGAFDGSAAPAGGITSDSVLGVFDPEKGCLGKKDFHIPFPVGKLMRRFPVAKDCCNGGGSVKKRVIGGKTRTAKNPYAKGLKTIVAEADVFCYEKDAARQFNNVIAPHQADEIYNDVLYYNDTYKLAWLIKKDGILHMYKPMNRQSDGDVWTVYATYLSPDGRIEFDYKSGMYKDENAALAAVCKAVDAHRHQLEEALGNTLEADTDFEYIDDIVQFFDDKRPDWIRVVKSQRINARRSPGGEKIKTIGSDGNVETERVTAPGDWVVNNVETPENVWIVSNAVFRKKYEPAAGGTYKPKGCVMLAVPVSACCAGGIEFAPPKWGGDTIKILNDGYFMKDPSDAGDIYAISKADFDSTYRPENRLDEQRFSPGDMIRWEASGRDPRYFPSATRNAATARSLEAELKQKFGREFRDVRLTDLGGTWKVEFSVDGLHEPLRGQRRVKEVIQRIDDIVRLLRIRRVETNQYNISAVPASLNESAPVVSDQTIDSFGASYYCIFGDPEFRAKVNEVRNSEKYAQMGLDAIQSSLDNAKDGGMRLNEFVIPAIAAYPLVSQAVTVVGGMVAAWLASQLASGAVTSATKTDVVAKTAAQTAAETVAKTPVADLGEIVVEAPQIPDKHGNRFWKWFLGTSLGGLLSTAGSFIATLFGAGVDCASTITIGLASALACGCAMLARHMVPVMASWVKKLRTSGIIAFTDFDSDGDEYRLAYSIRDNKWHMFLRGSRILNRRVNPSAAEIQQVMQTEFFRRFRQRCSELLHKYLEDPVNIAVLTTLIQQNEKELMYADELIKNKESVLARFDSPTFVSENEKQI